MSRTPAAGSRATPDPATDPERRNGSRETLKTSSHVKNEPMEVRSRGRLYVTSDIRRRLGCDTDDAGRDTDVLVKIDAVDRDVEWGIHVDTAVFAATIVTDGVIRVPAGVRETLSLTEGQNVRVSIKHNGDIQ